MPTELPETITVCGETYGPGYPTIRDGEHYWPGPRPGCRIEFKPNAVLCWRWQVSIVAPLVGTHGACADTLRDAVAAIERIVTKELGPLAALLDWARKDSRDA